MTNPKGTKAESALVSYLKTRGFRYVERRAKSGRKDRGDIAGIPGVVIEVKSQARFDLAGWVREARLEAINDDAPTWFVVVKAPGKGLEKADEWYAVTSVRVMADLLSDAPWEVAS